MVYKYGDNNVHYNGTVKLNESEPSGHTERRANKATPFT